MGIDLVSYKQEIDVAVTLVKSAMRDLEEQLVNNGFNPSSQINFLAQPQQFSEYASGITFFRRLWDELEKVITCIEKIEFFSLNKSELQFQRTFDEISLRQRKLYEAFCLVIMFSDRQIFANNRISSVSEPGLYFLDFHVFQELDYLRKKNMDLLRYFGGLCEDTANQIANRERFRLQLRNDFGVDDALCRWGWNERSKFENLFARCNAFEKAALGFGYQHVFGAASSQIHLNMSGLYSPNATDTEFFRRIDNLLLLAISVVLRAITIFELQIVTIPLSSIELRREFSGAFPNTYASAVIGSASIGDIVSVFQSPNIFLGIVQERRGGTGAISEQNAQSANLGDVQAERAAEFVSYLVQPLFNTGRVGFYSDLETMVILKSSDFGALIQEALDLEILVAPDADPLRDIQQIFRFPNQLLPKINTLMTQSNMTYLYFVQRYLERFLRTNKIRETAYLLWVEREFEHGNDLLDWFLAEKVHS